MRKPWRRRTLTHKYVGLYRSRAVNGMGAHSFFKHHMEQV